MLLTLDNNIEISYISKIKLNIVLLKSELQLVVTRNRRNTPHLNSHKRILLRHNVTLQRTRFDSTGQGFHDSAGKVGLYTKSNPNS